MIYFNKLWNLFHYKHIDEVIVSRLYALSQKSIAAILVFSLLLCYFLYPTLSSNILIWEGVIFVLSVFRIYLARIEKRDPERFTMLVWYKIFVTLSFSTATLFALVGSFGLFHLNEVEQLFVVATLVGMTGGAMSSLFPDIRIVIGYISIVIIPLIISLILLDNEMHIILAFLVTVYYITQIIIVLHTYKQNKLLEESKERVHKEELELFKKEEAIDYFFEQAPIGIFSYDLKLNITESNQAFLNLFHLNKSDVIGRSLRNLPDTRPLETFKNGLHSAQHYAGAYTSIKGFDLWVEAQCFPVHNAEEETVGGICLIQNKTKEHTALQDIEYLASHDPLTQLLNRRGLKEYMGSMMQNREHQTMYSLLVYLDLNKFKHINDSLGHKAGDELLIAISNRLKIFVNDNCVVSRFGGDEFIVVEPFVASNIEEAKRQSKACIERIEQAFSEVFKIGDMKLSIKTSLGIVVIDPKSQNIDEVIRFADIAMYQAKQGETDHVSYYDTALDEERRKLFTLQYDLLSAAEKNELKVYLQPLVSIKDDSVLSAESLLRWEHPDRGFLLPNDFIPMAIETGLISDITWWLVEEICVYIASLKKKGLWTLNYISINVNAKQLLLNHFVDEFLSILARYELENSDILIEITERSIIDNFEDTQDVITALRKEGIKCAIDDFGIGYSSLSYLKRLSFDTLKIDMEFIKDIDTRPEDMALVKTILDIAKLFNYHVVVEGIEEEKQKELLLKLDENLVYQGYLFSKAIRLTEFTEKYLNKIN